LEKNIYNKVIGNVLRGLAQVIVWLGVVIAWIREGRNWKNRLQAAKTST
jgi:hypothetical protein